MKDERQAKQQHDRREQLREAIDREEALLAGLEAEQADFTPGALMKSPRYAARLRL